MIMKRTIVLLGIGGLVGAIFGIVLGISLYGMYTFVTETVPETREQVQVFNELNELRDQINKMNEARKKEEEDRNKAVADRLKPQPAPSINLPDLLPKIEPPAADKPQPRGDFAEVDAEIARLEETQKILNAILDRLMTKEKGKER
jgi:hypothetical protein